MKTKVVSSKKLGEWHSANKAVWLRRFRFDKVRYFGDGNGGVDSDKPETKFVEFAFSLFVVGNKGSVWLKDDHLFCLKEVLAEQEEEEGDSPSSSVGGGVE